MVSIQAARRAWDVLGFGVVTAARQRSKWSKSADARRIADVATGARVLEIGGPSSVFRPGGIVPVYPLAAHIDNINFAGETIWEEGLADGGTYAPEGDRLGTQYLQEATEIDVPGPYDVVISSHTIEHTANPLRALKVWRDATKPGGHLLLVVPHLDGTMDHTRPITTLDHLREDEAAKRGEDDDTHFQEAIEVSDPTLIMGMSREEWSGRILDNVRRRAVHHHVFSTRSALEMVAEAGWSPVVAHAFWPYNIVILAVNGEAPGPQRIVSPFRTDRRQLK